jgi:hypothetical protein
MRFANAGFGNQLTDARNLMRTQAPPVPVLVHQQHKTVVDSIASEVANSVRQAALISHGAPKHGWEKGSYRSPFDYHIPGHIVGSKNATSGRSNLLAFPSIRISFIPPDSMTPAETHAAQEIPMYAMKHEPESNSSCRTVTPGPDVSLKLSLPFPSCVTNLFQG